VNLDAMTPDQARLALQEAERAATVTVFAHDPETQRVTGVDEVKTAEERSPHLELAAKLREKFPELA
jgi:hypothetical protein